MQGEGEMSSLSFTLCLTGPNRTDQKLRSIYKQTNGNNIKKKLQNKTIRDHVGKYYLRMRKQPNTLVRMRE